MFLVIAVSHHTLNTGKAGIPEVLANIATTSMSALGLQYLLFKRDIGNWFGTATNCRGDPIVAVDGT